MRRNFCGKHNNLKLFDGSSPKKLFLNLWQVWMLIWDNFQTWPGLRLGGGGMAEEALLDPGVEMRWMESSCTVWSPGQRWWRRGGRWGGARGRDRWAAPAHNSWWGWARAESCAGRFKEVSIIIYESANVWGKVFSFQWNWHCLCCWFYCSSSHCLGLSVISMQASPPATQRGKFNSNTYLPVLENPSYMRQIDFQLVQVEVLLVETTLARAALLHHHLPSHLLGLQVSLHLSYSISSLVYILYIQDT